MPQAADNAPSQRHDRRRGGLFPGPGLRGVHRPVELGQHPLPGRGQYGPHPRRISRRLASGRPSSPSAGSPNGTRAWSTGSSQAGTSWPATAMGTNWSTRSRRRPFHEDLRRAKGVLEDRGGVAVLGYRAPTFSIGPRNPWAFDVIEEAGHRYSSSIYPVKHDLYGVPDAPRFPHRPGQGRLLEIPMTTVQIGGRNMPIAGGGISASCHTRCSAPGCGGSTGASIRPAYSTSIRGRWTPGSPGSGRPAACRASATTSISMPSRPGSSACCGTSSGAAWTRSSRPSWRRR